MIPAALVHVYQATRRGLLHLKQLADSGSGFWLGAASPQVR